jgi:hypothetical protein
LAWFFLLVPLYVRPPYTRFLVREVLINKYHF